MSKKKTWEQVVTPQPEPDPEDRVPLSTGPRLIDQIDPEPLAEPPAPLTRPSTLGSVKAEETPEEKAARLDREDALTRASIPMVNGLPIPEHVNLTREQLENNPSDYHPPSGDVPIPVRQEEDTFVSQVNPSVMIPEQHPVPVDSDDRQQWLCLQDDGIRTRHPAFRSSAHLIDHMVACPECGNTHVRMVQPGEDVNDFSLLDWQAQRDRERERLALPRR